MQDRRRCADDHQAQGKSHKRQTHHVDCDEADQDRPLNRKAEHVARLGQDGGITRDCRHDPCTPDFLDRQKLRASEVVHQAHTEIVNDRFDLRGDRSRYVDLRLEEQEKRNQEQRRRPQTAVAGASSAAAAPVLIAVRMAALLTPPIADIITSFRLEAFVSRKTSWKKDIEVLPPG